MATTDFVDGVTVVRASWLNDVDEVVYTTVPGLGVSLSAISAAIAALATETGAASIGFKQAGTGSVLRTVQAELRDYVNVKQFGAVGDGLTNDSAAFQAALDYAGLVGAQLWVPHGVYLVPTATLNIPSGVSIVGEGAASEIRRTTNAVVPLLLASSKSNITVNHLKLSSLAGTTSVSSNTIGTGSKTFTIPAGLDFAATENIQISSTASPANYLQGTVTSYSSTTLVVNITASVGAGTFTAWNIDKSNGENIALRFASSQNCDATDIIVDGRFYVGISSQNGNGDLIDNCEFLNVVNRPIYVYATTDTTDGIRITKNRIRGGNISQYGINLNGSGGTIDNVTISDNVIDATIFQGIEVGGSSGYVSVANNHIDSVSASGGTGILVQRANTVQASRTIVQGNTVKSAGNGIYVLDSVYTIVQGNQVASCPLGIRVEQATAAVGCQYATVAGNISTSCTTAGFYFSGANVGLCSYHSCSANVAISCGIGFQSTANTDRIAFNANIATANTTNYSTLGTNHTSTGNI